MFDTEPVTHKTKDRRREKINEKIPREPLLGKLFSVYSLPSGMIIFKLAQTVYLLTYSTVM